jgi:streptogramin lyase
MFTLDARVAGLAEGQPMVTPSRVSAAQKEEIIKYFATHFGPSYKPRDLKTDALLRDEAALSQAIFIQYEVPPVDGKPFAPGGNGGPPRRSLHSAFASPFTPGLVFMSGNFSGSIVAVDTKNLDFAKRTREWRIDTPNNINVTPHGIYEHTDGLVYFTELAGDRIDALDPKTGKIDRFRIPTEGGGPHSLWLDSKGNVWFTYFAAAGKLARLDAKTRQVKEWEIPDFSGYGVVVDKQDRPWVVGLNSPVVLGYDAKSDKWTTYKISHPARRVTVDAKGNVWACEYYGNKIAMINPTTGTVTEYELPLKYGNPYDLWPDADDNIWVENAVYNSLVKFDQRTKQFTYFPFPDLGAHTPKLDRDKEGTLWFTLGRPSGLAAFKPKGNVS